MSKTEVKMSTFQSMPFPAPLQKALKDLNFIEPTEIQSKAIPPALEGKDLIACAETGSGKTAAYGLPAILSVLSDPKKNALFLVPTRELAQQVSDVIRRLTINMREVSSSTLVGGADIRRQLTSLKRGPRIVIATPGRLIDHLNRRSINLLSTGVLVLDEGDRMIDMGFAPQLDEILKFLPKQRQTLFFTATITPKVRKLAESYLHLPVSISAGQISRPVTTIKQSVIQTTLGEKNDKLLDELNQRKGSVIIFLKTKRKTDILAKFLKDYGHEVSYIHGGRTQGQRNQVIRGFREGKFRILCATDVAARGLDIPSIEHVINYDLPMVDEDYVHRIGRTGRNGASGEALTFVLPNEVRTWRVIAQKYRIQGVDLPMGGRSGSHEKNHVERPAGGQRRERPSADYRPSGERGHRNQGISGEAERAHRFQPRREQFRTRGSHPHPQDRGGVRGSGGRAGWDSNTRGNIRTPPLGGEGGREQREDRPLHRRGEQASGSRSRPFLGGSPRSEGRSSGDARSGGGAWRGQESSRGSENGRTTARISREGSLIGRRGPVYRDSDAKPESRQKEKGLFGERDIDSSRKNVAKSDGTKQPFWMTRKQTDKKSAPNKTKTSSRAR
ncbi:MAG: DEAD/DEAH box helicase [Bdellovibrionales bacterium]|nr:DEAD/DEAH box helicase [Bdellovibrionales bacterium]